ncbi:hypothetical protein [Marinobacter sp. F3R08]|uniref:hypothetical protein n=1 Tax=Marinobacter sp. F3R08 TaxID=2841559 RepID=UPI001C08EDEC|nr:hypothetical protein [Marinobacter sp. F3R08]MBU2952733.1 hypothetical protein [Marinobacter sp. F3R08]
MDYKEFKKQLMPKLDEKMAEIGFIRKKTSTPTYWKYPDEDERLVWVVCLNFSHRGNPLFDVLVTPYWIPCQHKDEPFPRGIGYLGNLSPDGFGHRQHTWWIKTPEGAEKSIQEVVDALSGPTLKWFQKYSTPKKLLNENPSAKLAADLGEFKQASELYRNKLKSSFINLLIEKKTTHATPYESVRGWEKERHERVIEEYKGVFLELGSSEADYEREHSLVELEALQEEKDKYQKDLESDPRSRWYKAQVKYCEERIDELNQKSL